MTKICLYSSVPHRNLFERVGFYRDDITALSLRGDCVLATNSLAEVVKFRPDLLVGYFYSRSLVAALLGRLLGAKVVLTGGADQISPILASGVKLAVRRATALLCLLAAHKILLSCSDDVANFEGLCWGVPWLKRKIGFARHVVIPAPPENRRTASGKNKLLAFTICWMGSAENLRRKGVDKAVKLIALLRSAGVDAHLVVAGTDGPGRFVLDRLGEELQISEHIKYIGPISEDEKRKYFAKADVYLQLSEHEGFGVAAAEAFFSGLTVAHSNKGGLKDVIGDAGIIVDVGLIENGKPDSAREFYTRIRASKPDIEYLHRKIGLYSIEARSKALLNEYGTE